MAEEKTAKFTPKITILGIISSVIVFVFFTVVLRPFVPDQSETVTWLFSAFTAGSLTGVFFMAFNCLAIILADPQHGKRR